MKAYFKSIAIILLYTTLNAWPNILFADNYIIFAYESTDKKYFIFEVAEERNKIFLPAKKDMSDWLGNSDWKKYKDECAKYFPFLIERTQTNRQDIEKYQAEIGIPKEQQDGLWGKTSWDYLISFLFNIESQTTYEKQIKDILVKIVEIPRYPSDLMPPEYSEDQSFFPEFDEWTTNINDEYIELNTFISNLTKNPIEIELKEDIEKRNIPTIIELNKKGFKHKVDYKRDEKRFNIEAINQGLRFDDLNLPYEFDVPIHISHKYLLGLQREIEIPVEVHSEATPSKYLLFIIPFFLVLISLFIGIFVGKTMKGSSKRIRKKDISKFENMLKEETEKILNKISDSNEKLNFCEGKIFSISKNLFNITAKYEIDSLFIGDIEKYSARKQIEYSEDVLSKIDIYFEKIKTNENNLIEHIKTINDKLLNNSPHYNLSSNFQTDSKKILDELYHRLFNKIIGDSQIIENKRKQITNLILATREIFEPFMKNLRFSEFYNEENWNKLNPSVNNFSEVPHRTNIELTKEDLKKLVKDLEISFPQFFKQIEHQLKKISLFTKYMLKPLIETSSLPDMDEDISSLLKIVDKDFFRENNNRSDWISELANDPFDLKEKQIKDVFWDKIWNMMELGEAMQITLKIMFKTKLILIKQNLPEGTTDIIYEIYIACNALLSILHDIAISCGRVYHFIQPQDPVSLSFVTKKGHLNILKNEMFKNIVSTANWPYGTVMDVNCWGVSKFGKKKSKFIDTIKSTVVVYDMKKISK